MAGGRNTEYNMWRNRLLDFYCSGEDWVAHYHHPWAMRSVRKRIAEMGLPIVAEHHNKHVYFFRRA